MSLKVSKITLGKDCPVGAFELTGLDTADLVLIVGPNGAGKSSLLAPLKQPGAAGRATTIDLQRVEGDFRAAGVERSISFITSQDLMAKVHNLDAALARAADASRHRVAARILEGCINALEDDANREANPPPDGGALARLSIEYLNLDSKCGTMPRTVESYDTRARSLAQAKGVVWSPFDPDPNSGLQSEQTLIPELRGMPGAPAAIAALNEVARLMPPANAGPAQQAEQARAAHTKSLASAQGELRLGSETTHEAVLPRLNDAVDSTSELIAAADHLLACRKSAREFLAPAGHRGERCECPVCSQSIHAATVVDGLDRLVGEGGPGGDPALSEALKRFKALRSELERTHEAWTSAAKLAADTLASQRKVLGDAVQRLAPANEWHDDLKQLIAPVTAGVQQWLSEHTGATVTADTALAAIVRRAQDASREVQARDGQIREEHAPQQKRFNELQAVGRALRARHQVNALQRIVDLDAQEAAAARAARRTMWLDTLRTLCHNHVQTAEQAGAQVLASEQVRERFTRLMERFHGVDPWLATLKYDGKPLANDLSEGQTVLVNLAAALTVASVAIGTPGHAPGWVVLDEPTNALDQNAVTQLAQYLGSLSNDDLPGQLFVATFDEGFANALREGSRRAGRRVRQVTLGRFDRAQPQRRLTMMTDETFEPAPNQGL